MKTRSTRCRFLSLLLCCIMLVGMFPTAVFAQETEEPQEATEPVAIPQSEEAAETEEEAAEVEAIPEAEEAPEEEEVPEDELPADGFEQDAEEPLETFVTGGDITGFLSPVIGLKISDLSLPQAPAGAPYKVEGIAWFDSSDAINPYISTHVFSASKSYFAKIYLRITDTRYEFSGTNLSGFTINGGRVGIQMRVTNNGSGTGTQAVLWTNYITPQNGHPVTTDVSYATFTGSSAAPRATTYTCTIKPDPGYVLSQDEIEVYVAGTGWLSRTLWTYSEATGTLTITANAVSGDIFIGVQARPIAYSVTLVNNGHCTIAGSSVAVSGVAYTCTVNPDPGYYFWMGGVDVYRDGEKIFGYALNEKNRTVTISGSMITGNLTITAKCLAQFNEYGMQGFVNRMYWSLLGRAPSEQNITDGVWQLSNGTTGIQYAYQFAFSHEFCAKNLCDYHFSKALFEAFIGRSPSESELSYRTYQLQQGQSREQVFNDLVTSAEFRKICTDAGITVGSPIAASGKGTKPGGRCTVSGCHSADKFDAFSRRLYTEALKRTPEQNEVDAWTYYLIHGDHTAKSASRAFFFSDELIGKKLSNEEFMSRLYKCMMNRAGSSDEIAYWVWCLTTDNTQYHTTREGAFNQFVDSHEFRVLCQDYGLICE
ncbi:MAG: DUF4214 domain-containing protein [Oscillospiraceae bacterium]|nr:DUF4214 domain-containing protein [Oscillospiraceae bacterium]